MSNFEMCFRVSFENSGKATYMAKCFKSYTPPYQKDCGNNRCEQDFIFQSLDDILKFIKLAVTEFGSDFEVTLIKARKQF